LMTMEDDEEDRLQPLRTQVLACFGNK